MAKKFFSKTLALILSLVMCVSLAAPAFAATEKCDHDWKFDHVAWGQYCTMYHTDVYKCTKCGETERRLAQEPRDHKYQIVANVADPGSFLGFDLDRHHWVECTECGFETFEPHDFADATCTESAKCACGHVKLNSKPLGHNYGEWTIDQAPTMGAAGTAKRVCENNAAHTETKTLPALTDTSVWTKDTQKSTPGTCLTDGKDVYTCTIDKTTLTVTVNTGKNAKNHDVNCKVNSLRSYNETEHWATRTCGVQEGESEPHQYHEGENECYVCGYKRGTPVHSHVYGDWTIIVEPTVDTEGTAERSCACTDTQTKTLPKLGASSAEWSYVVTTAPTCTTTGVGTYTFKADNSTVAVTIPVLGHDWSEWVLNDEQTQITRTCKRGCTETVNLPDLPIEGEDAKNWSYVVTTAPTCTTTGVGTYTFKADNSTVAVTIPVLGHDWSEWVLNDEQTQITRTCKRGCTETVNLPDLPEIDEHTEWSYRVSRAATCVSAGEGIFTYTKAGEPPVEVPVVLPIDHSNHVGGIVVRGGYAATETIPGYTGDTYCASCNALLALGFEIPAGTNIDDEAVPLAAGPVTRAEFIDYLWRHEGEPASNGVCTFTDVTEEHEFFDALCWAEENGVAKALADGAFEPDELVTVSAVREFLNNFDLVFEEVEVVSVGQLTTLTGEDDEAVLNCDEVLAEFFIED